MPHFEHTIVVAKPAEYVAAALTTPAADPLFAPAVTRVILEADHDGRAADLGTDRIRTAVTGRLHQPDDVGVTTTCILGLFAGPGLTGAVTYRLEPHGATTTLTQTVEYGTTEDADGDDTELEGASAAANDRRFAAQLATVKALLEADSQLLPAESRTSAGRARSDHQSGTTPPFGHPAVFRDTNERTGR